jgi:hypothetical protein
VIALRGVVGVVPVADVDKIDVAWGQATGPIDELGHGPGRGVGAENSGRLGVPYVEKVWERVVRTDRVDEVPLQALGNENRGHRPSAV